MARLDQVFDQKVANMRKNKQADCSPYVVDLNALMAKHGLQPFTASFDFEAVDRCKDLFALVRFSFFSLNVRSS